MFLESLHVEYQCLDNQKFRILMFGKSQSLEFQFLILVARQYGATNREALLKNTCSLLFKTLIFNPNSHRITPYHVSPRGQESKWKRHPTFFLRDINATLFYVFKDFVLSLTGSGFQTLGGSPLPKYWSSNPSPHRARYISERIWDWSRHQSSEDVQESGIPYLDIYSNSTSLSGPTIKGYSFRTSADSKALSGNEIRKEVFEPRASSKVGVLHS